jgi:hypothetical protein
MPNTYIEIENQIAKAVDAYNSDKKQKITRLAEEYCVPYYRLYRRIHDGKSKSTRAAANKALNQEQEAALILWIQRLDDAGCSPTPEMIEQCANAILKRAVDPDDPDETPRTVSKMWTRPIHRTHAFRVRSY